MSGPGTVGLGVGVGSNQPGVYVPLKALFLVCKCLNVDDIFFGTIEHLVCHKIGSKNCLTNKTVLDLVKTFFNIMDFLYKNLMQGR